MRASINTTAEKYNKISSQQTILILSVNINTLHYVAQINLFYNYNNAQEIIISEILTINIDAIKALWLSIKSKQ